MSDPVPTEGFTVLAHARQSIREAQATINAAVVRIVNSDRRIRGQEREQLWRELAGAVGRIETVRCWLDAGAPHCMKEGR